MINARCMRWPAAMALALASACATDTRLPSEPTLAAATSHGSSAPVFLALAEGAPPLAQMQASFYAVKGEDREIILWYAPDAGATDSSKFLRFKVSKKSLCKRPDGTNIASGDSLLISLTVTDPQRQIVQFEPSGLTFCSGRPAKLNMWYLEADHDFDDDGDIDASDAAFESGLRIWKQEDAFSPWIALTSILDVVEDEVEASITGFTNYVVAY